jgi:hypothetical protein
MNSKSSLHLFFEVSVFSVALFAIFLFSLAAGGPNAMEWDNFEFLTPLIKYTHEIWLHGGFPVFAFNQHMGDPLLANGQAGVFYFPYTVCLAFSKLMGWGALGFSATILWLHAWISGLGWYLLLRSVRVEPWIAGLTALGISCGGLYQFNTSIWLDMTAAYAWLGWTFLALHLFLQKRRTSYAFGLLVLCVALMGFAGHPQMMVYYGLSVILFLLAHQIFFPAPWRRIGFAFYGIGLGVLFATPSILPIFEQFKFSRRATGFSLDIFLERSTNLDYLVSLLNPVTSVKADFFEQVPLSLLLYQGSWVALGFIAGFLSVRKIAKSTQPFDRLFFVLGFAALTMFWLALGQNGGLYGLTYSIPIWSSFRWPFKIFYLALPCLAAAGGCGLQIFVKWPARSKFLLILTLALLSLIAYGFNIEWDFSPFLIATSLASGILILFSFLFADRPKFQWLSLALAAVNMAALVGLIQGIRIHEYSESFGSVGRLELGLDNADRILPLSPRVIAPELPFKMQEYSYLQSAMMNDYESATGCVTALSPGWRMAWLPADVFGVPYRKAVPLLLSGRLADAYNIGYYTVAKFDTDTQALIARNPHLKLSKVLSSSLVYKNTRVLPQVYWASEALGLDLEARASNFDSSQAPERAVFIEGLPDKVSWPKSQVDPEFKKSGSSIEVELNNDTDGFLALSYTWYPSWRAFIDGTETTIYRINGLMMGVNVPAKSRKLIFQFDDAGLKKSRIPFTGAIVLSLLTFLAWFKAGAKNKPTAK